MLKYTEDDRAVQRVEYAKRYDVLKYGRNNSASAYPKAKEEAALLSKLLPLSVRKSLEAEVDKKYQDAALSQKRDAMMPEYKKGGTVKKTGLAKVHKGEYIIPAERVRKLTPMEAYHLKRNKKRGLA
jgi:hypothetical protein